MTVELLTFVLQGVPLALLAETICGIDGPEGLDQDVGLVLGLSPARDTLGARSVLIEREGGQGTVRLGIGRPEFMTVADEAIQELPALVLAHPGIRGLVLVGDRPLVLLEPQALLDEAGSQ